MTDRLHRWSVVAIKAIDVADAPTIAAMPMLDRLDHLCELFSPPEGALSKVWAVRGPICADCRVTWEDVERMGKPWPCPGPRPDDLGGPLLDPPSSRPSKNRQQRRRRQREDAKRGRRHPSQEVSAAVAGAVAKVRQERSQ